MSALSHYGTLPSRDYEAIAMPKVLAADVRIRFIVKKWNLYLYINGARVHCAF